MTTNLFSVLSTVVRIAALLHVVSALGGLIPYFASPPAGQGVTAAWIVIIGSLISAGLGLLLWLYPGLLVRPAVGRAAHEIIESPLSADDILRIGLCLLGVWFAFGGLSGLAYTAIRARLAGDIAGLDGGLAPMLPDVVYYLFTAVLGLALALGSRGLINLLSRLRGGR